MSEMCERMLFCLYTTEAFHIYWTDSRITRKDSRFLGE